MRRWPSVEGGPDLVDGELRDFELTKTRREGLVAVVKHAQLHRLMREYALLAQEKPESFRRQAHRLFATALIYVVAVLLLLASTITWGLFAIVSGTAGIPTFLITVFAAVSFWAGMRGIFSRVRIPGGHRLKKEEAPALFEMVDALREEMQVKEITAIWIDGDFNAAAPQRPLFGLLGMSRYHLSLGLPLLAGISVQELRSVVAHELAHFEADHPGWSLWTCRVCEAWVKLSEAGLLGFLMWPLFWISGNRILAINSVVSRQNEFEADAREASLVGAEVFAKSLLKVHVLQYHLHLEFIPAFTRETATLEHPPRNYMTRAIASIQDVDLVGEDARQCLRLEGGCNPDLMSTHPTTLERVRALLGKPEDASAPQEEVEKALKILEGPREGSALDALIDDPANLVAKGDEEWGTKWKMTWSTSRREWLLSEERLEALNRKKEEKGSLIEEEAWERVSLAIELQGSEKARPLLNEFVNGFPDHGLACLAQAIELHHEDKEECLEWAKRAAKADPIHKATAIQIQQEWLRARGRIEEADSLDNSLFSQLDAIEKAEDEREELSSGSEFDPHDLPAEVVERVVEQLQGRPIKCAYLVKRKLKELSDSPQYVLAIQSKRTWWRWQGRMHEHKIILGVISEVDFPYEWLVESLRRMDIRLQLRISKAAGGNLLKRSKK